MSQLPCRDKSNEYRRDCGQNNNRVVDFLICEVERGGTAQFERARQQDRV